MATEQAFKYWEKYKSDSNRIDTTRLGCNAGYLYLADDDDIDSGFNYNSEKYLINDKSVTMTTGKLNINKLPNMVGDYCTEFAIAVIQYLSNGDRGNIEENPENAKKNEYGIILHNTYAHTMHGPDVIIDEANGMVKYVEHNYEHAKTRQKMIAQGSINFYNAMIRLGYKRYFAKNMTVNDLRPGDLLVSDYHVEFYYGYEYEKDKGNNDILEIIKPVEKEKNKAISTFGWGNVNKKFPFVGYYFFKDGDSFRLNRNGEIDENEYEIVWRLEWIRKKF